MKREILAPHLSRISAALDEENEAAVVAFVIAPLFEVIERVEPKPRATCGS